ncbi:hypothetical protein JCM10212_004432 [Sporobolomyces blumeae]
MSHPPPGPAQPQGNAVEMIRYTQETIRRRVDEQLSPADRLIAHSAEDLVMRYARFGFWVGTGLGGLVAFRSRLVAGRSAMQRGQLPRLFYPTKPGQAGKLEEEAAKQAAKAEGQSAAGGAKQQSADEMRRSKAVFFGKAVGYGILGSVVGTQVGVYFGRGASDRMLKNSGRQDAIAEAQGRGIEIAVKEIMEKTGGKVQIANEMVKRAEGNRRGAASGMMREDMDEGVGYQEPGRELSHETMTSGVGYSDRAPPQENFPESLAGSAPPGSSPSPSAADSSGQPSRWEELRRSRASPPSRWDILREANNSNAGQASHRGRDEGRDEQEALRRDSDLERERRKREFEALMDKEAQGGDDGMGDRSWR